MKNSTSKITKYALLCFILALLTAILCACGPNYKDLRTKDNIAGTAKVGEHSFTAYFFTLPEEDGTAILQLTDENKDGKVAQTIEFPAQSDYYASLDFEFAFEMTVFQDMNFDGNPDLYVPCSVTTENLEGMAWLWDSDEDAFVLSEELSALYELTVFPEDELITSQDYSNPDGILCKEFKWEEGKLTQVGEYTINN